tara:strand:+ start:445 stop:594 length:150 start_codon:yes stop_codon:yes gene_type:complete
MDIFSLHQQVLEASSVVITSDGTCLGYDLVVVHQALQNACLSKVDEPFM